MPQLASSLRSTIGVEWELALVDQLTRELVPHAPAVLSEMRRDFPDDRFPHAAAELLTNTVELVSAPHHKVNDTVIDLRALARAANRAAQTHGAQLIGSGTHPFSRSHQQSFTDCERYDRFAERYQWWGRNMLIWGVHIHVGVDRPERAVPLMNALYVYLPHLLAVSVSSPFWAGESTQYASNRTLLFQQLPSAGLPPDIDSWAQLETVWQQYADAGIITDPSEARWDIRPAPQWGTLEVRVCDGAPSLDRIAMLTALVQCLTEHFQVSLDTGTELPRLPQWCVRENKWRAARYGLDTQIIVTPQGAQQPLRSHLTGLLQQLYPIADRLGCRIELHRVAQLLVRGTSAQQQLSTFAAHGGGAAGLQSVVDALSTEFSDSLSEPTH